MAPSSALAARAASLLLLCGALLADAPLGAQSSSGAPPPAVAPSAVEVIDLVATRASDFLLGQVPDTTGEALWLAPFLTDTGAVTRLGHRLQSAIHLRLLEHYRSTTLHAVATLPPHPTAALATTEVWPAPLTAGAGYALALELQPFRDTIRIVLRLLRAGELQAGDRIDVDASPELRELLDGTGQPAAGLRALIDPTAPSTVTVDQSQIRYIGGGEDWLELRVPAPGFYLLEARSFGVPLDLALYHDRGAPPVVAAWPSRSARATQGGPDSEPGGGLSAVALFAGRRITYVRVSTATQQQTAYHLLLTLLSPPRRFADAAPFALASDRGVAFHTLRIFAAGTYAATLRERPDTLTMRVFGVPDMALIAARADPALRGPTEYDLRAGDYLVEIAVSEPRDRLWVCWAATAEALRCGG